MSITRPYMVVIIVALVGYIAFGVIGFNLFKEGIIESKKQDIAAMLNIARNQSGVYVEQYRKGLLSKQQADEAIIAFLSQLRSGTSYLWANDEHAIARVHIRENVIGEFQRSYPAHIARLKKEPFFYVVETNIKPISDERVMKVNGISIIPGWDWVIGYGVYADDQDAILFNFIIYFFISLFCLFSLTIFLVFYLVKRMGK